MSLRLTVPLGVSETPASFASRLAARNGLSAREFCLDWTVRFQQIVDGDRAAVARIADKGGADVDDLMAYAFVRCAERRFEHRGEFLVRASLRRSRICICPVCLLEDICRNPDIAPHIAIYGRAAWLVDTIRTCPAHHRALVEIADDMTPARLHDFAYHARSAVPRLEQLAKTAVRRKPGGLETYVFNRFDGRRTSLFLDGFPLYAAIQICEVLGAVAVFGRKVSLKRLDADGWWRAGLAGFEIASEGEAGIRTFLDGLKNTFPARPANDGPQAMFGRALYDWAARGSHDVAFDRFRDVLRAQIEGTFPLAKGTIVLGKPVEERRWHSVRTATREAGLHPKRLAKLLNASGAVPPGEATRDGHHVLLPARAVRDVIDRESNAMSLEAIGEYANVPRIHREMLGREGFIKSTVGARKIGIKSRYARSEVDAFLVKLLDCATPVSKLADGAFSIPAAAKRACCTAAEIIRLVLERKLAWTGRLTTAQGYMSLLVSLDEIRQLVRREDHGGISLREVEKTLKSSTPVVRALIDRGKLISRIVVNPINRCPQEVVDPAEIERFKAAYVSLYALAGEWAMHFRRVAKALKRAGIEPKLKPGEYFATFYLRADVPESVRPAAK